MSAKLSIERVTEYQSKEPHGTRRGGILATDFLDKPTSSLGRFSV